MPAESAPFDHEAALSACARGERFALRALLEREAPALLGAVQRIVGDTEQAEDVLQGAFLQVWQLASTFRPELGSARGWIWTLVRHRALKQARESGRGPAPDPLTLPLKDLQDAGEPNTLPGEFVLGTLDPDDHAGFAAALPHDRALQAAVYAWQDRLLPGVTQGASANPGPDLWRRIDAVLSAGPQSLPTVAARLAELPLPWWQRLSFWQGLGSAALASSLVLGALLMLRPDEPAGARYVALLQSPDRTNTGWVVELRADRLRLVPVGTGMAVPAGRCLQFWTRPQDAPGPTSLGLVQAGQRMELPLSRLPGVGAQQWFEITLEPEGGSTLGQPSGPVLFGGRSVAL